MRATVIEHLKPGGPQAASGSRSHRSRGACSRWFALICLLLLQSGANAAVPVIEFYNANQDHYFMSSLQPDIDALDSGRFVGWVRTGQTFWAYPEATPGASPVCRFYIPPAQGDSHFYSASPTECAQTAARFPTFIEESADVMYIDLPDPVSGACPTGDIPVFRVWDDRVDSNHRYAIDRAIRAQMVANGWIAEGYGPDQVIMCAATYPAPPTQHYLVYDGATNDTEVPSSADLSISSTGLTIEVWMRPDTLTFPHTEGSLPTEQYVHWLGKGQSARQEYTFRMYSLTNPAGPRQNRVSFYVFNANGGRGCGSYFQDPLVAGQWVQVVGVADQGAQTTSIYKNGALRHSDSFAGIITPTPGTAPLRFGSKDFASFFQGAIGPVRVWNRPLNVAEVEALYASGTIPQTGLVAQYLFNEGSGGIAHDIAQGHDGNVVGAQWGAVTGSVNTVSGTSGGGC